MLRACALPTPRLGYQRLGVWCKCCGVGLTKAEVGVWGLAGVLRACASTLRLRPCYPKVLPLYQSMYLSMQSSDRSRGIKVSPPVLPQGPLPTHPKLFIEFSWSPYPFINPLIHSRISLINWGLLVSTTPCLRPCYPKVSTPLFQSIDRFIHAVDQSSVFWQPCAPA